MSDQDSTSGSTGNSGSTGSSDPGREKSGEWTDAEMDDAEPFPMPEVDDDDAEPEEDQAT